MARTKRVERAEPPPNSMYLNGDINIVLSRDDELANAISARLIHDIDKGKKPEYLTPPNSSPDASEPGKRQTAAQHFNVAQRQALDSLGLQSARYEVNEQRRAAKHRADVQAQDKYNYCGVRKSWADRKEPHDFRTPVHRRYLPKKGYFGSAGNRNLLTPNKRTQPVAFPGRQARELASPVFPIKPPEDDDISPLVLKSVPGLTSSPIIHPIDEVQPDTAICRQGPRIVSRPADPFPGVPEHPRGPQASLLFQHQEHDQTMRRNSTFIKLPVPDMKPGTTAERKVMDGLFDFNKPDQALRPGAPVEIELAAGSFDFGWVAQPY